MRAPNRSRTTRATARSSSNTVTVSLTVSAVNHAPVAVADSYSTNKNTALNVNAANGVLKNDTDPDGDTLTAALDANVAHGTLSLSSNGSFTYTPTAGYGGADSFTYHANDGTLNSNTVTVSLTVSDRAPVAVADSYSTNENTALNVNAANGVLKNDTDPDGDTLTAVLNANVAHGTLTLNSDGSFTYTPTAGYGGPDSFTYHANDGTLNSNTVDRLAHRQRPCAGRGRRLVQHERGHALNVTRRTACSRTTPTRTAETRSQPCSAPTSRTERSR